MPPKPNAGQPSYLVLRTTGGESGNSAALAPKLGPLGLNPRKIGDDIAKATKDYKGLKVTVQLEIINRQATVSIIPSASTLVIKELNEPPKDKNDKNILHDGDLTFDQVYNVAKVMRKRSLAREMAGTVKEILGTCNSVGCTVDGKSPQDVIEEIDDGTLVVEPYEAPEEEN
eukprot:TRINITY_DN6_c0_g1_i1.p1 TRINITY_DN6_c0_g1~~TRINITY_DN6_c0_g1_i1.p1  ORF type:complete len:172 (-),score=76.78 TRINITY_DN6_c0_g1_i1:151-666(-)